MLSHERRLAVASNQVFRAFDRAGLVMEDIGLGGRGDVYTPAHRSFLRFFAAKPIRILKVTEDYYEKLRQSPQFAGKTRATSFLIDMMLYVCWSKKACSSVLLCVSWDPSELTSGFYDHPSSVHTEPRASAQSYTHTHQWSLCVPV